MGLRSQEYAILDALAGEESLTVKQLAERCTLGDAETWIESLAADQWIRVETIVDAPKVKRKEQLGIRS